MENSGKEAKWWSPADSNAVRCRLCPRCCLIAEGRRGFCGVRRNTGGRLYSEAYGYPVALQVDPIEKKPLYHYLPGTRVFSAGSFGCNLGCLFCQNSELSRGGYNPGARYRYFAPEELVFLAQRHNCRSIAFTYNEPTVCAEYAVDTLRLAKDAGLGTVLVTNGYISREAAAELYPLADAANIDVKGFSEEFYREMCSGSLKEVLESCEFFKNTLGKHLEITNLVIPGKNSSEKMIQALLDWAAESLGLDTPLHFSAYHPAYRWHESPHTPVEMLQAIREKALAYGFQNVHLGNIG